MLRVAGTRSALADVGSGLVDARDYSKGMRVSGKRAPKNPGTGASFLRRRGSFEGLPRTRTENPLIRRKRLGGLRAISELQAFRRLIGVLAGAWD